MNAQFNPIDKQKDEFANEFIEAISSKSIEACKRLIINYEERVLMFGEVAAYNPKSYDCALTKQCREYFKKADFFIDKHIQAISTEKICSVSIYELSDDIEFYDGCSIKNIKYFSISMKEQRNNNFKITNVGFQINDAIIINGKIKISNFLQVSQRESTGIDKKAINDSFSSPLCRIDTYKNLLKDYPQLPLLQGMDEFYYIKLYCDDAVLEKHLNLEDFDVYNYTPNDEGIFDAIYILGSLTVKGNIYNISPDTGLYLYVEGSLFADNIRTGGSNIKASTVHVKNICLSIREGQIETNTMVCSVHYGENNLADKIGGIDGWELDMSESIEGKNLDENTISEIIGNGGSTDKETQILLKSS